MEEQQKQKLCRVAAMKVVSEPQPFNILTAYPARLPYIILHKNVAAAVIIIFFLTTPFPFYKVNS